MVKFVRRSQHSIKHKQEVMSKMVRYGACMLMSYKLASLVYMTRSFNLLVFYSLYIREFSYFNGGNNRLSRRRLKGVLIVFLHFQGGLMK